MTAHAADHRSVPGSAPPYLSTVYLVLMVLAGVIAATGVAMIVSVIRRERRGPPRHLADDADDWLRRQ